MKIFPLGSAIALLILNSLNSAMAAPLAAFLGDAPAPTIQTYKTLDSGPLTMATFFPADWNARDKRPAIIFIHGGAWVAGDATVFYPHARYFATRGAVCMSIDYRLEKPDGSPLRNCLTDCKSAVRYVRAHAATLGVDPDRIATFGDSAGGHLAAAVALCPGFNDPTDDLKVSCKPEAMILCNPILDMTEGAWIKFILQGAAMAKGAKLVDMHPTAIQLAEARALSPASNIAKGQSPALLMQGTKDTVVNPVQAQQFAPAYTHAGNRCDLIWMEGARHAFVLPKYTAPEPVVVDAISKADKFLVSLGWLSGPPTLEVSNPPAFLGRK